MTALACSFCGRNSDEVAKLVAGPKVYICDECVAVASRIMNDPDAAPPPRPAASGITRTWLRRIRRALRYGGHPSPAVT